MNDMSQSAGRREWIGLAVLTLPTLLVALDIGALFLALPHLSADLGTSSAQQLWITDIYGFLLAGFLITMGSLGDRIGRRRLLLVGAAAFALASVLAAFSVSPGMLIAARALLGVAGATLGPSTLALISNMFRDPGQRGVALSLWGTCQFAGAALGPVIGGVMLAHFWWGSVFLLGVPVMLLLMAVGPVLLPEYRNADAGRLDLTSVALSLAAILPVIYGIKELALTDRTAPSVVAIAAGIGFGAWFLRRQFRLDNPLVDPRLFRARGFRVALTSMLLASAALAGTNLLTSQYVQTVAGFGPERAGLLQAPTGVGIALGVLLAPVVVKLMRTATAITTGMALSAAALLALTQVGGHGGTIVVVIGIAVVAFGVGPLFVLGTGLVVGSAPPEKAGSAAALSETSNIFGTTLGFAILGSVGAAIYRDRLGTGVPASARETIAGAASVAAHLPGGAELFAAAREAFTTGMNVVAGVSAVVMIALALVNRPRSGADPEPVLAAPPVVEHAAVGEDHPA